MTYYDLLSKIKTLSTTHQLVNEFGEGDVYEYMNSGEHKYPCIFMTMDTINTSDSGTAYNFTLFYIDRLTEDNTNKVSVQTTGVSIIKQIINKFVHDFPQLDLSSTDYTLFTEKFADYCGGAFCNISVNDMIDTIDNGVDTVDCEDLNFGQQKIIIDTNGTYELFGNYKIIVDVAIDEPVGPDLTLPYVTFTAEEAGSTIGLTKLSTNQTLEYSTDTTNWNTMDTSTSISLPNVGDKVYIRGILSADNSDTEYTQFKMTGKIAASGNCNAIWNYQDLEAALKTRCGYNMFRGCISLTTAPELPATTLVDYCYRGMFHSCTNLTIAPELPATELAYGCYITMFNGCTALTTAPELPATTLASYCYEFMFRSCTNLTIAPELPATTLVHGCYANMFQRCTNLTTAPNLPATTLADGCYQLMFDSCTKLNSITCLATDISADYCTSGWVDDVSSTGTFVKHPDMNDWTTGENGIPEGWIVINN